jgi:hypothetical protein
MKSTSWPQEVIDKYGQESIWTATWREYYVQHYRHHQTYVEAEKLAREHNGQVLLPVAQFSPESLNRTSP